MPFLIRKLPKEKTRLSSVKLLNVDHLPEKVTNLLVMGPKFAIEPKLGTQESLALVRRCANRAPPEKKDSCLVEGVDTLFRWTPRTSHPESTKNIVPI